VTPQTSFTNELLVSIEPIYAAILRHPFIAGLTDGSLPRERFEFYAVQDALYLREFARALAIAGARAPKDDWIVMLTEHAVGALRVERTLHEGFFREFELTAEAAVATPLAPTTLAYTSPFPHDEPLRVDVLGHGLPAGSLARLIGCRDVMSRGAYSCAGTKG
jgi:thiaminase/transcriptional activator TenA